MKHKLNTSLGLNTHEPLVSIIMPLYNSEKMVSRSIYSVINQTYSNWELVVVDDGSTDNSLNIIEAFNEPRIRIFKQTNQGASTARNYAVSMAQGEYLAFLDSDDIWFPEKLEADIATLKRNKTSHCIIYTNYYVFDENDKLFNIPPAYRDEGLLSPLEIVRDNFITASGCFIHRHLFDEVGGFPTHIKHYEDIIFLLLISRNYPVFCTGHRHLLYRHSLSGKARKKLSNYNLTVDSILDACSYLKPFMSSEEFSEFINYKRVSIIFSFLMYNYLLSAKKLAESIPLKKYAKGKKGLLAYLSIKTGFNFMYYARIVFQNYYSLFLSSWWKRKTSWAFLNTKTDLLQQFS